MRADLRTTTPVAAVVAIAAAAVLVHVAFSLGYGHHRDELYFLAAGRRLALGYVDQPPLTPLLARLSAEWFGGSLAGLRLFPALGHGALVVLAALLAAEFGGGRVARWLAAVCVAVSSLFLVAANSLSTTAVDQVVWVVAAYLVVRLLRSGDGRWWLGIGAAVGVGLQNKHTVLLLAAGLAVALVPARLTGWLRTPWPWAGAAVALALWAPNLWWQAANGWPTLTMLASLQEANGGLAASLAFAPLQIGMTNPFLAPVWIAGLWRLLRAPEAAPFRLLGWLYVAVFAVLLVLGGKAYYLGPLYGVLLPAGAAAIEGWLADRPWLSLRAVTASIVGFGVVAGTFFVMPGLAYAALRTPPLDEAGIEVGAQGGWAAVVRAVLAAYRALPAEDRARAAVLTENYGEAGAIEHLGAGLLPTPHSGHNTYWLWGPPAEDRDVVVAIGFERRRLQALFGDVQMAGRVPALASVAPEERGAPIWVCREPRGTWAQLWPRLREYRDAGAG
jgi:4-amino-4-deoxy-L-arabinose transferase-like glycosyltransferase